MQQQATDKTKDKISHDRIPVSRALPMPRMKVAVHARNTWHVTIPETAKYDDVFNIGFWQVVENQFTSGDLIEVTDDAGTFWALLMVRAHVQAFALSLVELIKKEFPEVTASINAARAKNEWTVVYRGPFSRWCVVNSENKIVKEGHLTREEALMELGRRSGKQVRSTMITG